MGQSRDISGVPQGSVLGSLFLILYISELFNIVHNDLYGYADDSTLVSVIDSSADRLTIAQSLDKDLERISEWCSAWGMKLNAEKTKTMIISRSRTTLSPSPLLTLNNVILQESSDLCILGVNLDSKLTFERHIRSISKSVSQKLGIMRKTWGVFHNRELLAKCFYLFVLPVLEYCSPVWFSAADSHLRLLDRLVTSARLQVGRRIECDLWHR